VRRPGGCPFAEDPRLRADQARIFWTAEADPHVVTLEALPGVMAGVGAIDFARLDAELFVQLDGDGGERVLLRRDGVQLRLDVASGTILDGPVTPRILLLGVDGLAAPLLTVRRLAGLSQRERLPQMLRPHVRRAWRWAQMVQALDGLSAGASQRDLAMALFGADRVAAEWRGFSDHLRLKVRRIVREARRLVGGGYRALLRHN